MHVTLTAITSLVAVAHSWMLTGYETDLECDVDTGRYRIWENTETPSVDCQVFGGSNAFLTCAQYENGGFVGPVDCGSAVWSPRSIHYDGATTVNDVESCYSCKFYSDSTCGEEWKSTQDSDDTCFDLGYGPKSFICRSDDWSLSDATPKSRQGR
ncbi:hypothetical protein AK830_g7976 [Neonectria ditissima]|uniref:Cyanovirin-N domain-containing protein n=1 Tax=Neonectria ditissima TaxID=78410 RepID=A0A0P7B8Z1_9HYPO|nr:hypothetical protein AK830_g7976 [Neonectria ditissima]